MYKQANLSFSVTAQAYGDDVNAIQFSTQDKNSAKLVFSIKEGKAPLNLADVDGIVDLVMGDKSVFEGNKAEVTGPLEGKLEYTITPEQIRHPGKVRGELKLVSKSGQAIGGFRFNFTIKKSLLDEFTGPIKEFYIEDLEAVKKEVKQKADAVVLDIDKFKGDIESRTAAIEEQIDSLDDDVAQSTVLQVDAAKKDTTGQTHANLDSRIKAEVGKITTKQTELTTQLAEKANQSDLTNLVDEAISPKLTVSQVGIRENVAGKSYKQLVFKDIHNVYDVTVKTTGSTYGLLEHDVGAVTQGVYKSLDGGDTWFKLGELPIDEPNKQWFTWIFVEPFQETFYLLKTKNGHLETDNDVVSFSLANGIFTQIGVKNIGTNRWLSSNHSIDAKASKDWSSRVVMFGEYGTTLVSPTYSVWRTTNRGATWTNVLSFAGDVGTIGTGVIRHFHCVQADPFTGDWWAATGDTNPQCRIYRSKDDGLTWELMFSGSQRERTCGFLFEQDYIYYGMDSTSKDVKGTKIVRIKKSDMSREDVGIVDMGYAVYSLTKIQHPEGFLVWACHETNASVWSDRNIVQFYNYNTGKLYPAARFNTKGLSAYTGFQGASRHQDTFSGNVFALPTPNLQQAKYGATNVSRLIKVRVST